MPGEAAYFFADSGPEATTALIGGVGVPLEPPDTIVPTHQASPVVLVRLDDAGERLIGAHPFNFTGCTQLGSIDVAVEADEVEISIGLGPFPDEPSCTDPGGVTGFFPIHVPGGIGERTVVTCDEQRGGCRADGVTLDEIPRVRSIRTGCIPSLLWVDVMSARNRERMHRCDAAQEAAQWGDLDQIRSWP